MLFLSAMIWGIRNITPNMSDFLSVYIQLQLIGAIFLKQGHLEKVFVPYSLIQTTRTTHKQVEPKKPLKLINKVSKTKETTNITGLLHMNIQPIATNLTTNMV